MKKIILSISAIFFFGMLSAQTADTVQPVNKTEITFTTLEHNYGTMEFGANGICEFEFTNTGKEVLTLSNVEASCGCTVPTWSKDPIKPGGKGKITVKYNTQNPGRFQKQVRVFSNSTVSPVVLNIMGLVNPKAQTETTTK